MMKTTMLKTTMMTVTVMLAVYGSWDPTVTFAANHLSPGTQWVRSHDFNVMGLVGGVESLSAQAYRNANMSAFLAWSTAESLLVVNDDNGAGLPWQMNIYPYGLGGLPQAVKDTSTYLNSTYANNEGWLIWDEPDFLRMNEVAAGMSWYRSQFPDALVYSNAVGIGGSGPGYYGDNSPAGQAYSFEAYITDFVNVIQPDVMMYDTYPYRDTFSINIFPALKTIRENSLSAGIPYWAWIQSAEVAAVQIRTPSESELRKQVFQHLAYGFTGISYFTYSPAAGPAMANNDGTLNQIYYDAQSLNSEVANLGNILKYLTSTDVRFVPNAASTTTPTGIIDWVQGAGGDTRILDVSVDVSAAGEDGMIGFFTDDDSQEEYFMLVNLLSDSNSTAAMETVPFTIQFDNTIDEILRLDKATGIFELISLTNNKLDFILPGGTGDLFKYNTRGDFDGNGTVGLEDYVIMKANFLSTGNALNLKGELAGPGGVPDGIVNGYDFLDFKENLFPGGASAFASAFAAALAASEVPEPSAIMLLLAAAPAWLSLRFRSKKGSREPG